MLRGSHHHRPATGVMRLRPKLPKVSPKRLCLPSEALLAAGRAGHDGSKTTPQRFGFACTRGSPGGPLPCGSVKQQRS